MKKIYLLLFSLQCMVQSIYAQSPGSLNESFATSGVYTHDFGGIDVLYGIEVQGDGKIVSTGVSLDENFSGSTKVIRLLQNGTPDPEFGDGGYVNLTLNVESYGYDLLITPQGKILIAGISALQPYVYAMAITQLNEDGSVDSSFGTDGTTAITLGPGDEYAYAMTLQSDNKILIAGNALDANYNNVPTVVRLTEEGDLDPTFDGDGVAQYPVTDVENELRCIGVQSDGKIVVGGHYAPDLFDVDVLLLRFNSDGSQDETFGQAGAVKDPITLYGSDECYGLIIDQNDEIIITGYATTLSGWDGFIKKYNANGIVDSNFGTSGTTFSGFASSDVAYAIVKSPFDEFLVAGTAGDFPDETFALWRFNVDGTIDTGFGENGAVYTNLGAEPEEANALALVSDGLSEYIVIAGKTRTPDTNFDCAILQYFDFISGIEEQEQTHQFNVYPNPAKETHDIFIQQNHSNQRLIMVEIFSAESKQVFTQRANFNQGIMLPKTMAPGIYSIRLTTENHDTETLKLVITN